MSPKGPRTFMRVGHGAGAGQPHVEIGKAKDVPAGVPEDARPESPTDRGERGHFARGNAIASKGGKSRAGKVRLAERLGLGNLAEDALFAPYRRSAVSFRKAQCAALAATVGGGMCGPGPSSLVASASLQLAWSRFFADAAAVDPDPDLVLKASRLAEASRQSLLAAHSLCALEAEARSRFDASRPYDLGAELRRGLPGGSS